MRLGWIANLLLAIGVIGLAVYAFHKNKQPKEPSFKLSQVSSAVANKIVVEPRTGVAYSLEKRGEVWFLTTPTQARADQTQVQRILDLLSASSKEKLAATQLERFDLVNPTVKVTINDQSFAFGTTNPLTQEQYVATTDGVYLLSAYFGSLAPSRADRMLTHRLLSENETPVGFTFKNFSVIQKDGKWTLTPQPAEESERPSQDDLNRFADDWRFASSLATQPWTGKTARETVQVKLADGKVVTIDIVQKEPELILSRSDEKLQFQFSAETGKRLLRPEPAKDKRGAGAS
jgi:hypothetical protein